MNNRIKELDHNTIQQIAAGEIINDPAAIVKETVENSLDANSTEISVEIKNGGKSYIRISDNGEGILREDIPLAFKRHSTSKLFSSEDLYNIESFGFRGEALASIIAVSKVELLTKSKNQIGSQSFVIEGKIKEIKDAGCPNGTSLIIRDIFYNFPVRKNFLKSDLAEGNKVTDTVSRLALGNPKVSFKYIRDNKVIFKTPGNTELIQTIHSVLGKDFSDKMISLDYEEGDIRISGYVSNNNLYRSNRSHQYLYVNNRYVFNKEIRNKIESLYKSVIPNGRFPVYVLFIDLDPSNVDVNIHPTKEEVKFTDINRINNAILSSINPIIESSFKIPNIGEDFKINKKKENLKDKEKEPIKLYKLDDLVKEQSFFEDNDNIGIEKIETFFDIDDEYKIDTLDLSLDVDSNLTDNIEDFKEIKNEKPEENCDDSKKFKDLIENLNIKTTVFSTFIICEDRIKEDLILIDQHAAHERIMYEKLLRDFKKEKINRQVLLEAEVISLTDEEFNIYLENKLLFNDLGLFSEEFGDNTVIVREVPIIFGEPEVKKLFFELLDNLAYVNNQIKNVYDIKLDKIMKLACTYAIKAGDTMDTMEIDELLKKLSDTSMPYTCPHGRPTVLRLNKRDINKLFKRIM